MQGAQPHAPAMHVWPASLHAWPQLPQLFLSVWKSTHDPEHMFGVAPPHVLMHENAPVAAREQKGVGALQALPQDPQLAFVPIEVRQPRPASSQSA